MAATEDTVVAAVRMAYRVAEAQIRSARLAQRLRESGDRAVGARSDRKAIDATEQLIVRAMMSGLAWVEGLAGDRDVLRRLLVAQNKIQSGVVESILGFPPGASRSPPGAASDAAPAPRTLRSIQILAFQMCLLSRSRADQTVARSRSF